jgi:hypothetical protein
VIASNRRYPKDISKTNSKCQWANLSQENFQAMSTINKLMYTRNQRQQSRVDSKNSVPTDDEQQRQYKSKIGQLRKASQAISNASR